VSCPVLNVILVSRSKGCHFRKDMGIVLLEIGTVSSYRMQAILIHLSDGL